MNLDDDVVYRCRRLGPVRQRHPGRSRGLVRYDDRFHVGHLRDTHRRAANASVSGDLLLQPTEGDLRPQLLAEAAAVPSSAVGGSDLAELLVARQGVIELLALAGEVAFPLG